MVIAYIERHIGDKKVSAALTRARNKSGNALEEYIIANGVVITAGNYLNNWRKYSTCDYEIAMLGEPSNAAEKMAWALNEYGASYIAACKTHPEDICEERTTWSEMEHYANQMSSTLSSIINYLADNAE